MTTIDSSSDAVSALADGALHGPALVATLDRLASDAEAQAQWHAYHLIGDVLRSEDLARSTASSDFMDKLQARLAQEEIVRPVVSAAATVVPADLAVRPAANGDSFRWKMAAGFASLAAVAAIGWNTLALTDAGADGTTGAVQARADAQPPVMLRNAQLDELLAAHNQAVGGAALQSQAGYVRSASFETPQPAPSLQPQR